MDRRDVFSYALFLTLFFDAITTIVAVNYYGLSESNSFMIMLLEKHPALLVLWAGLWGILYYVAFPYLKKARLNVQAESVVIIWSLSSIMAGIGNIYVMSTI